MENKLIVVIGAYGSGKSEYSVNLAKELRAQNKPVILVDLDVVNPYFRTRDVREKFEQIGIEVVAPQGEFKHADLPMMSPRIMGAVQEKSKYVILDVGGDPAGCRTIARYIQNIKRRGYEMHLVVNTKRPFTSSEDGILEMIGMLEFSSKLKISEIICNTNLMEYTSEEVVTSGIKLLDKIAKEKDIIFDKYLVLDTYKDVVPDNIENKKRKVLNYFMNKPWEDTDKQLKI